MRVSLNDFTQALEGLNVRISNEDAKQVFDFLDTKNFKYLTLEEFAVLYDCQKGVLNSMNEEQLDALQEDIDIEIQSR